MREREDPHGGGARLLGPEALRQPRLALPGRAALAKVGRQVVRGVVAERVPQPGAKPVLAAGLPAKDGRRHAVRVAPLKVERVGACETLSTSQTQEARVTSSLSRVQ